MSVIRVKKTQNYTCMSNEHLRDRNLSLKAKGLLSLVLSLPDAWKYSIRGLASICKESVSCVSAVLNELEEAGYLSRRQLRDENGRLGEMEYIFSETPCKEETDNPYPESPCTENPDTVFSDTDKPYTENPAQLNKELSSTEPENKESNKHPSIINTLTEADMVTGYSELIKDQIEYESLRAERPEDEQILQGLFELMLEIIFTKNETMNISGTEYPTELVKSKLLKLKAEHIRYVIDSLKNNMPHVVHLKKYMTTALFNALTTRACYKADIQVAVAKSGGKPADYLV